MTRTLDERDARGCGGPTSARGGGPGWVDGGRDARVVALQQAEVCVVRSLHAGNRATTSVEMVKTRPFLSVCLDPLI
jgi:hypothetical protein